MNGIGMKMQEDQERMRPAPIDLSTNLVCPTERLFVLSLDELKTLEQRMFEIAQREYVALNQRGAAYELRFNEQRVVVDTLRRFVESHKSYSPLADGLRLYDWIRANAGGLINASTLQNGWTALKSLDEMVPAVPPTITSQPEDQAVEAGEAAVFIVSASGTTPFTYQWRKNGINILGATKGTYVTPATEFSDGQYTCIVSNDAGSCESAPARLKTIYKQ